jgi:hypothetical protein
MDSGLINLIPSLVSRRSAAAQRDEYVDPPPPYIQGQYDHFSSVDVPLSLDLCLSTNTINSPPGRSSMWSHDATMALELDTTYQEFMALLQRKICHVNFFADPRRCQVAVMAVARGRTAWQFGKQQLDVTPEN